MVQGDRLARQGGGPAAGEGSDHGAQGEPFGGGGNRGQRHPGVGHRAGPIPGPDVIPEKEAVPARHLGSPGQVHQAVWIGEVAEVGQVDGEAHHRVMLRRRALGSGVIVAVSWSWRGARPRGPRSPGAPRPCPGLWPGGSGRPAPRPAGRRDGNRARSGRGTP